MPDDAARESVALIENENVIVLDTSTAHRTNPDWTYGIPELNPGQRDKIRNAKRIAVPGCYATGFITTAYALVAGGILPKDYPVSAFAVSGYSGGGKKLIAEYEAEEKSSALSSARLYALGQTHKHLKEMKAISGLTRTPLFSPMVTDYYSGMTVSLSFYADMLNGSQTPQTIRDYLAKHYEGEKFIKVQPLGAETDNNGILFFTILT